jgi:uncharacterized protein (TIGR02246 family)
MRRRLSPLALLAAPVIAAAVASCVDKSAETVDSTTAPASVAAPNAASMKADEDSVRALSKRWSDMIAAHDTVAIGALFADDGAEFAPGFPSAKGPAAVTRSWAGLYKLGKDVKLTPTTSDITVSQSGDIAVERSTYQLTWTDAKGKAMSDHGNSVTVYKKVNGQWKVFADIAASEVPPPSM